MTDEVATYRGVHDKLRTCRDVFSERLSIRRNRHFTSDIRVIVIPYTSIKGEEATLGKCVIWRHIRISISLYSAS